VCVLQTTLDLIESGYEVHILVDGVSSQRLHDRAIGLHRATQRWAPSWQQPAAVARGSMSGLCMSMCGNQAVYGFVTYGISV
jgi:hypothetical protein